MSNAVSIHIAYISFVSLCDCLCDSATLTQHGHAPPLAGEVEQSQELILAKNSQLRDGDGVSCPGKKNPAELPGCTNQGLLIWGCSLVNQSLWKSPDKR